MKDEPKIYRVPSPGDGQYWEQIERDGKFEYIFYHPPTEIRPAESWSFDSFNATVNEEGDSVHYLPEKNPLWFLSGEPIEPGELWADIRKFVYDHIDFTDPRLYDVATGWIMSTWIKEAFNVSPYFRLIGVQNTGKTRVLEVFQELCYRAVLTPSVSEAALYRLIQDYGVTYLLDETEHYTTEAKTAIQNVLNSGYRRGQKVIRCNTAEDGSIIVDGWDVFGPKGIAGTQELRETLESRCIQVVMQRATRDVNFNVDKREAKRLRSRLQLWRFRRLSDKSDINDSSDMNLGAPPKICHYIKNARIVELYSPMMALSEGEARDNITTYAIDAYSQTIEEEGSGVEAEILTAIINTKDLLKSGTFSTTDVTLLFNEGKPQNEHWKARSVGRVIKKLGFTPKRMTGGIRGFIYDVKLIKKLSDRYDAPPLQETSLESLTSLSSLESLDHYTEDPTPEPDAYAEVPGPV